MNQSSFETQGRTALRSDKVLFQLGDAPPRLEKALIVINEGVIEDVRPSKELGDSIPETISQVSEYGSLVIMPGLVDSHIHINEPGRTDWEGFDTATKAAAAGGVTTVIDMPLNCLPVTTTASAFQEKLDALQGKLWVDCGFHGGIIPGNSGELEEMIRMGIRSFKAFLIHSGIDEFPESRERDLDAAMPILAKHNIPLLAHAEMEAATALDGSSQQKNEGDNTDKSKRPNSSYQTFLASRPESWEVNAIKLLIKKSRQFNCHVHIVHLSSALALKEISQAKKDGVKISVETCPHYLLLDSDSIPDGNGWFKCAPPIRNKANQDSLWLGLKTQIIDFVVSDHSPCLPKLKLIEEKNLRDAWGGISSLQFGLSLIWPTLNRAVKSGPKNEHLKQGLTTLNRWMSHEPAKLVGLHSVKGKISPGFHADFAVWNPDQEFQVEAENILHKHKGTPYLGRNVRGQIHTTYVRGQKVFELGKIIGTTRGEFI